MSALDSDAAWAAAFFLLVVVGLGTVRGLVYLATEARKTRRRAEAKKRSDKETS